MIPAVSPRGQTGSVCPNSVPESYLQDRWELLSIVTYLRKPLGLSDRDIAVLQAHLTVLPKGPLRPESLNVSFMEVGEILARANGMCDRKFRRGETALEKAGLVARRLSANGRRYPERDGTGRIVSAYGIDLAPLIARRHELAAWRDRMISDLREVRRRANSVSARLAEITRRLLAAGCELPGVITELRTRLRRLARRVTTSPEIFEGLEREVEALEKGELPGGPARAATSDTHAVETAAAASTQVSSGETPIAAASVTTTGDAGHFVRHNESPPKEDKQTWPARFNPDRMAKSWRLAGTLNEFYPEPPTSEHQAAAVLYEFSSFIGLRQPGIARALCSLGWENTLLAVDYLAGRITQIARPEGYLTSMLKAYERGESIAGGRITPPRLSRPESAV